jgi:amidase
MAKSPVTEKVSNDTIGAFLPGAAVKLSGSKQGPLKGLSFAAKDAYDIAGHVTGCGNPDWARTHKPATAHAYAVEAWLEAGANLIGKTITDELAYSLSGRNIHYGTPVNVNAPGRIPGGSSSGSAAAVAGGLADLALGSDTGGSVRTPAGYCGVYGIRSSHGRIPLQGAMPLAPSFDTAGWFAREAELLLRAGAPLFGASWAEPRDPKRLVILEDAFALAEPVTRQALGPLVERLKATFGGAEGADAGEPGGGLKAWMWRFITLQGREIWKIHGPWIERVHPAFGPEIAEHFAWAKSVTADAAEQAAPEREAFAGHMAGLLDGEAIGCLPTTPSIAPRVAATVAELGEHRSQLLALNAIAGLARLPQVTLPLASVSGCPIGLSLIAGQGQDEMLLAFAQAFCRGGAIAGGQ